MTVPLAGVPLPDHAALLSQLPTMGYTDVWTSEVSGTDAFTPLALASVWSPTLRLGSAIVPVFTRGPGLLAMQAATIAEAAPGRFAFGIGASSPVVVGDWNAVPFDRPFERSRDVLRFLRKALAGEVVDGDFDTFTVRRFRLERPPAVPPRLLLAGLRGRMLRLAAAEADGAILNWLSVGDVATARAELTGAAEGFEVAARIFVCPTADPAEARETGRRLIAAYLTVPAYAAFHRWLGRGEVLKPMWDAWAAGDRKGAVRAIPDEVVDDLIVHGAPEACREHVRRYAAAGVTTPVIALLPTRELTAGGAPALLDTLRALGDRS
ncbi:LLM class F420-dependent oxidoreductase [Dactylosporangium sp. AC04546]|uniref:LLM class F420-dependent oxidoreductase n=1 Tax=Dactylosporangium sp. AC04546 TaxID=2862460 RepID=UPI001EDE7009|nr:LLM class F420-dependent oxidoreductase [Dactylosporangium sp. AC04546]WVK89537.1 LLM class F420-dependent oxidoreductase [Dactylosporangium sp. AC04546]